MHRRGQWAGSGSAAGLKPAPAGLSNTSVCLAGRGVRRRGLSAGIGCEDALCRIVKCRCASNGCGKTLCLHVSSAHRHFFVNVHAYPGHAQVRTMCWRWPLRSFRASLSELASACSRTSAPARLANLPWNCHQQHSHQLASVLESGRVPAFPLLVLHVAAWSR